VTGVRALVRRDIEILYYESKNPLNWKNIIKTVRQRARAGEGRRARGASK
jgi:hypothetical protein